MKQENLNACQSCTRELGSAAVLCLLHSSDCLPLSFGSFLTPLLCHTLFYCVPPWASMPADVIFSDVLLLFTLISWFSFQLYLKVCLACALGYGKVAPLWVLKTDACFLFLSISCVVDWWPIQGGRGFCLQTTLCWVSNSNNQLVPCNTWTCIVLAETRK